MEKIFWLINRLRAMSILEILYRTKKKIYQKINKKIYKKDINIIDVIDIEYDINDLYNNLENIFNDLNYYNIKISDNFSVFNEKINFDTKYQWHKGFYEIWNKDISSYDIEFKNTDKIGDIRYTWEINRHQFMPYLASVYIKTNDSKYLNLLEKSFEDWVENNKFLKGINWSSSMEIALRAYQWLLVLYILKDIRNLDFKNKICKSIIASIKYVMNNLSLYSSANNHLIIEAAISSIIGYCFRDIYNQNWFDKGNEILKKELKNQFHEDGVNKEQALHYQAFVTDMMLQYNSILKKIGYEPIEEKLIMKSVDFINSLSADKNYIDFGDSDDAKIVSLCSYNYNYYDYILSFASNYYNKKYSDNYDKYPQISLFINKNIALEDINEKDFNIYKDGGYSIIKHNNNIIVFDFGELGFGGLAAHGHADALMVLYSKNYKNFFIDSGTYIYNIKKEKRDYYRGTKAHNTLCYRNINQSEIKGPFLWGKKSKCKLINYENNRETIVIEASNDGYKPNLHKRRIEYIKKNECIIISDYFQKNAELNFILDENVIIKEVDSNILKLCNKGEEVFIYIDGNIRIDNIKISKLFLTEVNSTCINITYSFERRHLTLICSNLDVLKEMKSSLNREFLE